MALSATAAMAGPWSTTFYAGPETHDDSSQIFLKGQFHPDGTVVGIAVDRDVAELGSGFTLADEGDVTHFITKQDETTVDLGVGVVFHEFPWATPTAVALFTGPSWADDPPLIGTGTFHGAPINFARMSLLEYVSAEMAMEVAPAWSAVLRFHHRSGGFGLFAPNADEGSMFGVGIRRQF